MDKTSPKLKKIINSQFKKSRETESRINKSTARHIVTRVQTSNTKKQA